MNTLRIVEFDIHGKNPVNKIVNEKIPIKDKTCPWVIPDGSPFFGDYPSNGSLPITIVYDDKGRELVRDRDYWLEEEFMPLVEVTGRPIVCFIKLSPRVLAESKFVTANYITVGAYFIPRNSLEEWLTVISKGNVPIPFEKVFGVPPTVPAEWHSHSIKTEIGDWFELTLFYTYVTENLKTRKGGEFNVELDDVITKAFTRLYSERDTQYGRLREHDSNYLKPHLINKGSVLLGNHPNFATATLEQDKAGTRSDLLSTPQGVQELLKDLTPDVSEAVRNGTLPLSKFSNGSYIPPAITGSFEGLGSGTECMGICVELSGLVVIIQAHNDGRNAGLYFSTLDEYSKPFNPNKPYEFKYSSFQYEPPVLKNIGVTPNHIIAGSGNDVIMVGATTQGDPAKNDRWFLALTNNSFDPASHRYIETNMSKVFAQCGMPDKNGEWPNNGYYYHGRMSVSLLENWVVLAVDYPSTQPSIYRYQGRMSYWRIPRSALINSTPATWEVLNLTYRDYDNVLYSNLPYWEYAKKQLVNDRVTRWGRYVFTKEQPIRNTGYFSRRLITLFAKKPGTTNIFYMNWLGYTFLEYIPAGKGYVNLLTNTNMVYELNIDTGVMTLLYKQPVLNIDYTAESFPEVTADQQQYAVWYNALVRYTYPATVVLENGDVLVSRTGTGQESARINTVVDYFRFKDVSTNTPLTTKADLVKGSLGRDRVTEDIYLSRLRNIQTPIPIGVWSHCTTYENDGENFMTYPTTVEHSTGYTSPKIIYRKVSGGYAIRPQVFNLSLSPLYSRPLSNDVWETNMTFKEGVIGITGTSTELDNRGLECGNMSLSSCGWSAKHDTTGSFYLSFPSETFQAADKTGTFLTFPKTFTRAPSLTKRIMEYKVTSFYGLPTSLRDKIRNLIPAAQRGGYWAFSIFMLNTETGGMFTGLNSAILYLKYPTKADGDSPSWDGRIYHIRPIVEAPNSAHPGCHLIKDFTILGQSATYITHRSINQNNRGASMQPTVRPSLNIYRNGNLLECKLFSGFCCVSGSWQQDIASFQLNIGNGVINSVGGTIFPAIYGTPITNIPRLGPTKFTLTAPDTYNGVISDFGVAGTLNSPSGGAAEIFNLGNAYYAAITAYPESGWSIFFLEEVEVMFSGTLYKMPMGIIDLRDIDNNPANKTFYIFATMEGQRPQYIVTDTKLRQTSKFLHAATVTTGANQILLIERRQPFLVGDLELSYSRKGGSIPVSSGFPQDEGNFTFLRAAELLP